MRKITQDIANAWVAHKPRQIGNTMTDGESVWLHGNLIARRLENPLAWEFTLAGWNTVTTRERLNGLLRAIGAERAGFVQRKGQPVFVGLDWSERPIDAHEVITIRF